MGGLSTVTDRQPPRSDSMASSSYRPARVERARVISVDINKFTVDVRSELAPYKTNLYIPWMVPYTHFSNGEGINFMPEVGSICWVCDSSENGRGAFVLGWMPIEESSANKTYRAGREMLNPGDLHLSTRDGNFVFIRRGGILQIGATPVCQRIFIPIKNTIQDFAENYEMHTPAGDLTWSVLRKEEDGDGHQGCLLTLLAHEFADDEANKPPLATLKIGSHGNGDSTILTLLTQDKTGGSVKTNLTVDKTGNLKWLVEGTYTVRSTKDMLLESKTKATMQSDGDMLLKSGASLTAKGASGADFLSDGPVKVKGSTVAVDGRAVNLGDATANVVILNPSLKSWIDAVTTAMTTNAVHGSPPCAALKPPIGISSSKVKA